MAKIGKEIKNEDKLVKTIPPQATETASQSTDIHWIKETPAVVRDNPKDG